MGSANKTEKLELSQFGELDKPTWTGDYSGDMRKIESGYAAVEQSSGTASNLASTAMTLAGAAKAAADAAGADNGALQGQIEAVATAASSEVSGVRSELSVEISEVSAGRVGATMAICRGYTRADVIACLDKAEALGKYSIAYFPAGVYDVGVGISLAGYTCQIRGEGSAESAGVPKGTVFYASTQNGAVLDFTGWVVPKSAKNNVFQSKLTHSGFGLRGSGVSDPTKKNAGLRTTVMSSCTFTDISIRDTGGPGWESAESAGDSIYLCDVERVVISTPVDAQVNDVPYMVLNEPNGSCFRNIGFRSEVTTNDCGVSGAFVVNGNSQYSGYAAIFDGFWFEYLHVPANGSVVNVAMNRSRIHQFGWHDCFKINGATNTSYMKLSKPAGANTDMGGNIIDGLIPGNEGYASAVDMGIKVLQSGNRIQGVRGYFDHNVHIEAGVERTYVDLGGTGHLATGNAVYDNSGNLTNIVVDSTKGAMSVAPKLTVRGLTDTDSGAVMIGTSTLTASVNGLSAFTDTLIVRNVSGTAGSRIQFAPGGPVIVSGTGTPEGVVAAQPGSIYLNLAGGASTALYVKQTGTANTGWVGK